MTSTSDFLTPSPLSLLQISFRLLFGDLPPPTHCGRHICKLPKVRFSVMQTRISNVSYFITASAAAAASGFRPENVLPDKYRARRNHRVPLLFHRLKGKKSSGESRVRASSGRKVTMTSNLRAALSALICCLAAALPWVSCAPSADMGSYGGYQQQQPSYQQGIKKITKYLIQNEFALSWA